MSPEFNYVIRGGRMFAAEAELLSRLGNGREIDATAIGFSNKDRSPMRSCERERCDCTRRQSAGGGSVSMDRIDLARTIGAVTVAAIVTLLAEATGMSLPGRSRAADKPPDPVMASIAAHEYVRSEFDREARLVGSQLISISSVRSEAGRTLFTARVETYDKAGRVRDTVKVEVACNAGDPTMLMGVLDLRGSAGGRGLDIGVDGDGPLVPPTGEVVDSLGDIRIKLRARGGWGAVIGGQKIVTIRNRRADRPDVLPRRDSLLRRIRVREDVSVVTLTLGLRLRSQSFRGEALFDSAGGLARYELTAREGALFLIERRDNTTLLSPARRGTSQ